MKNKFNIGDLVQLKKHCKARNRAAMVLNYNGYQATIVYIDTGEQVHALPANLEFLDESG